MKRATNSLNLKRWGGARH